MSANEFAGSAASSAYNINGMTIFIKRHNRGCSRSSLWRTPVHHDAHAPILCDARRRCVWAPAGRAGVRGAAARRRCVMRVRVCP